MKKNLLLLLLFVSSFGLTAVSQENKLPNPNKKEIDPNFARGTMQIAIEGLNFGWAYGRVTSGVGVRYGYFVRDNGLLFLNGEFSSYGKGMEQYQIGLAYRQYFNTKNIKPYVQLGANMGRGFFTNRETQNFHNITVGGGATFKVGRFGFDMGLQINIWDKVTVGPRVGVSYSF